MSVLRTASGIIAGLSDAALLLDRRLCLVDYNQAFLRFAGVGRVALSKALARVKSPFELFGEDAATDASRAMHCLESGQTVKLGEIPVRTLNQETLKAHVAFVPVLGPDSHVAGIIYSIRDVSAESRVQGAYKVLIQRERFRANQLERKVEDLRREARLAAVERDLELTATVQALFLPTREQYDGPSLRLRGFYLPADQCGGDWWWHERISTHEYLFMVGDATGHGPGAAMLTASVATAVELQRSLGSPMSTDDHIQRLHAHVRRLHKGGIRMTMSLVEINERDGYLRFYSAGGTPLLCMTDKSVDAICERSRPLGDDRFSLSVSVRCLVPNERILIFTDGLSDMPSQETADRKRRRTGVGAVAELLESTRGASFEGAFDILAKRIRGDVAIHELEDDLTFVLAEWSQKFPRSSKGDSEGMLATASVA